MPCLAPPPWLRQQKALPRRRTPFQSASVETADSGLNYRNCRPSCYPPNDLASSWMLTCHRRGRGASGLRAASFASFPPLFKSRPPLRFRHLALLALGLCVALSAEAAVDPRRIKT